MIKIILYILLLSIAGIIAFFLLLDSILHRIFHLPQVKNKRRPEDLNLKYKEVFIETVHHKKLQVFELNSETKSKLAFICVHGWANSVDTLFEISKRLAKQGEVYLLNTRNHGESDHENNMTIVKYETDIWATINYIKEKSQGANKIIIIGHSLGGAAALLTAQNDSRVSAVVSISTFADMRKILYDGFLKSRVPRWFINSLLTYIEFRIGRSLHEISPANVIRKLTIPVLLIHGTKDEVVDYTEMEKIYKEANKSAVEKFVAKGHNHSSLLKDENVAIAIENFIKKRITDA